MKDQNPDVLKAIEINRQTWNDRTNAHYSSGFYDSSAFAKAKNSLNSYEINALGNVTGKSVLHLQCHFGQDSLSWAHKGATVTGVDFSETAINKARELSAELKIPAKFVSCNVFDTASHIDKKFDIVFTSYGVIGWLPDLKPWAQMIATMLKPGGTFYMVEFHPIAWMFDYLEKPAVMKYPYSNKEVIYEEYSGSYASTESDLNSKEYTWNHPLSEVIQSLIDAGLTIELFAEHDGSPYNVFPEMTKKGDLYYLENQLYPTIFEIKATRS
ncbi:class I SAM-dependent methyltransferase [Nonlabens ponticola]|uniref:Class I SAM-dependent methyltransferase n=1 Tax=Nonlabens ponticola TaxID=2496866 RepID=A0A3S9MXC0_9FLAO|nr:class I SAM-dependent methyltransferase [Nonlabens ponticola]AZQ43840.1 class I SAM-dependent methyltransferase [Nonlabens ponticola]